MFVYKIIQPHKRLENRAGIQSAPPACCVENIYFTWFITYFGNNVVGLFFQTGYYDFNKFFIFTYVDIVFHSKHNVFAAPHIPALKFIADRVRRNSAKLILRGNHIVYTCRNNAVKRICTGTRICHTCTAHHFTPVFSTPELVFTVGMSPEHINKITPKRHITKLFFFYEFQRRTFTPIEPIIFVFQFVESIFCCI